MSPQISFKNFPQTSSENLQKLPIEILTGIILKISLELSSEIPYSLWRNVMTYTTNFKKDSYTKTSMDSFQKCFMDSIRNYFRNLVLNVPRFPWETKKMFYFRNSSRDFLRSFFRFSFRYSPSLDFFFKNIQDCHGFLLILHQELP